MKQREVYYASLSPVRGSEQGGRRPVVVISGPTMNVNSNLVIVCPITSKRKMFGACVQVKASKSSGLKKDSEILTFQPRTVSKNRLKKKIGMISKAEFGEVVAGLFSIIKY